jgi:ankyrin repeat protein
VDVGCPHLYNSTVAHFAARGGDIALLERLAALGADFQRPNFVGEGPLHFAAESGHTRAAEWLLRAGADVHAGNTWNETAIGACPPCAPPRPAPRRGARVAACLGSAR